MKRAPLHTLGALFLGFALAGPMPAPVFMWTGIGNGWRGQTPPPYPGDGTAVVVIGNSVRQQIPLAGSIDLDRIEFTESDPFRFTSSAGPITLTLRNGVDATADDFIRFDLASDITLNLAQNQVWQMGSGGAATIHGPVSGPGNLTFNGYSGALVLANLTGTPSSHTGQLTLELNSSAPIGSGLTLAVWGANSIGSGTVTFTNGGIMSVHQAPTLSNNLVLNSGPLLAGQLTYHAFRVRSWDSPTTTLSGSVTLANNTILNSLTGFENKSSVQFANSTGVFPKPGPISRNPVIFSGAIGETGPPRSLNVTGQGIFIFSGTNTYSGGTKVGFAAPPNSIFEGSQGGSLIFANSGAIPAIGLIQSGIANINVASGYVGFAASAFSPPGSLQTILNTKFVTTSSGSVGVDTLPGESIQTFSDSINLSLAGFNTSATGGIRLGTATSAILTGTITPQLTTHYNFGNGGGKLYVQSSLINLTTATQVLTNSTGAALELYLQGNNTYTGGTTANSGFLVFDGPNALPASGALIAGNSATNIGFGYLGHTQATGLTPAAFLSRFDQTNTWGVIGFDTNTPGTPVVINNLDLNGFNDGVFIGTKSEATLTGTIGLTTVGNGSNAANTLRLTAATGGTLNVAANIVDGGQPVSVLVGTSNSFQKMADGQIVFSGVNTYTGGTSVVGSGGITLVANSSAAFGAGPLNLLPQGGLIGLEAGGGGVVIDNNIVFVEPVNGGTPNLHLGGIQNFIISGDISGPALPGNFGLGNVTLSQPISVSLTGNNAGFAGFFTIFDGTLHFGTDTAAGTGTVGFNGPNGTAAFTTGNPVIHGLDGDLGGTIRIGDTTNLIINRSNVDADYSFAGTIMGFAGASMGSLTVTGTEQDADFVYLSGDNQFIGGTTILGSGVLALGHNNAAGQGGITVNAPDGGLALNSDVVLTNPLTLTSGALGGLGTFAPSSFNGTPGAAVVIGTGMIVVPGIPDEASIPGTLTVDGDMVFASGGDYQWMVQDPSDPEGFSLLHITGSLDLASLPAGGFTLDLQSLDSAGTPDTPSDSIVYGQTYSLAILHAAGGISGFDSSKFTLATNNFQGGIVPLDMFGLSADANNVYLSFTAVPEPSTWALMLSGAAFLGLTWFRRRSR